MRTLLACATILGLVVLAPGLSYGSGAPGPTGPLVIDKDDDKGRFFIGGGYSSISTTVEFDELDVEFEQQAVALTIGKQFGRSWSVAIAVGLILGGELELEDPMREFDIDKGFMSNVQVVRQWTFGAEDKWFVAGEFAGGIGLASSAEEIGEEEIGSERVTGFDVRAGAMAGRDVGEMIRPYLITRGFVGPINWTIDGDKETGTDKFFFQVGAGITVDVPLGFTFGLEGAFLGERRVAFAVVSRL